MAILLLVFLVSSLQTSAVGLQREKGPAMDETPVTINVTQGNTAVLPCEVDPHYTEQRETKYKVVWVSPDRTAISLEDRRMINDRRISVERPFLRNWNLHIRNVSVTDTGEFMCQLNTVPVKSKSVHLLVFVPPSIVDYTQPVELTRLEGEQIALTCNATGLPKPTVSWFRTNRWTTGSREMVGTSGEQLVIHNATKMCADVYTCVADNGIRPSVSQEFVVEINYRPEIKLHNHRMGQEVGKETILECEISAFPQHISRWRRGDLIFSKHNSYNYEVTLYEGTSEPNTIILSLRIIRVEPHDYGFYLCEASNNFGRTSKLMELYEVQPKPSPTPTPTTTTSTTTTTTTTPRTRIWDNMKGSFLDPQLPGPDEAAPSGNPGKSQHLNGGLKVVVDGQKVSHRNGANSGSGDYNDGASVRTQPSEQLGSGSSWTYVGGDSKKSTGNTSSPALFCVGIVSVTSLLWCAIDKLA